MKVEINGQQAEELSLSNWKYNVVRIQNELKHIIENKGGEVVTVTNYWPKTPTYVRNRSLMERIKFIKDHLERLDMTCPQHNPEYKSMPWYLDYVHELEHLKSIPNEPILRTGASAFVLDGIYYGLIFDDNMFLDTYYLKAKVFDKNGSRVIYHNGYGVLSSAGWKYDCLIRNDCSQEDIHRVAMCILNIFHATQTCHNGDYVSHIYSKL